MKYEGISIKSRPPSQVIFQLVLVELGARRDNCQESCWYFRELPKNAREGGRRDLILMPS